MRGNLHGLNALPPALVSSYLQTQSTDLGIAVTAVCNLPNRNLIFTVQLAPANLPVAAAGSCCRKPLNRLRANALTTIHMHVATQLSPGTVSHICMRRHPQRSLVVQLSLLLAQNTELGSSVTARWSWIESFEYSGSHDGLAL